MNTLGQTSKELREIVTRVVEQAGATRGATQCAALCAWLHVVGRAEQVSKAGQLTALSAVALHLQSISRERPLLLLQPLPWL